MAEAIFNTKAEGTSHKAVSAGMNHADRIQPETLSVLLEGGFIVDGLHPKPFTTNMRMQADRIIAMDDWVAEMLEGRADEVWDIPDPYRNPIDSYRRTRDILVDHVEKLIRSL